MTEDHEVLGSIPSGATFSRDIMPFSTIPCSAAHHRLGGYDMAPYRYDTTLGR